MFRRLCIPLVCFPLLASGLLVRGANAPEPLTTCAAVRNLPPSEAARGLPVRLRGVVTLLPTPGGGGFTLDDGTGIWMARARTNSTAKRPSDLDVGDWVEVTGRTQAGFFLPTVAAEEVTRLGRKPIPPAQEIGPLELTTGALDGQRVQVQGVVQAAERTMRAGRAELRLVVSNNGKRFSYVLFGAPDLAPDQLVDAEVQLGGVFLAYFNARRQFLGVRVRSNDPAEFIIRQQPPSDAFAAPEIKLSEGVLFSALGGSPHRRRARGVVTLSAPGEYFFLQDQDRAIRVSTRSREELPPGTVVEASGFFSLEHNKVEMLDAVVRRVGSSEPLAPVAISSGELFSPRTGSAEVLARDLSDALVSLSGKLVSIDDLGNSRFRLNLDCDEVLIPAEISLPEKNRSLSSLRVGSDLRVTGVCILTYPGTGPAVEWPQPSSAKLLLRDPADIEVIRAASWWTIGRLGTALGVLGGLILVAFTWVAVLRRRVAERSRELAEAMRERRDAAVEFESTLRERNRLAADLHDTLEQSLTGLSLQLEASEALRNEEAERSRQHMTLAKQVLERSREDLRRSIWNLRASPLENADLTEALREIAASRSAGLSLRIEVESRGEKRPLPDFIAGNLLMLVQEGITNSIKHANPAVIHLGLEFSEKSVSVEISDDGLGFDVDRANGPKQGHFGLQGMRERMKRLGGQLRVESQPGAGTRVRATVPL